MTPFLVRPLFFGLSHFRREEGDAQRNVVGLEHAQHSGEAQVPVANQSPVNPQ